MLVGERPFLAETPIGVLLKHLQDPPPSVLIARPDLPPAVGDVLEKVLVKNRDQRYSSAGELARAFRAAFYSLPVARAPVSGAPVYGSPVAGSPLLVLAWTGGAALDCAGHVA